VHGRGLTIDIVLDTWAWVEYWKGNERVRDFFEGPHSRITSMITIAELERFYGTDRSRMDRMIATIRSRSLLVPIDLEIARTAGSVRRMMKEGGIADAIIYATALRNRARVVTGDPHFRALENVIFVEPA
jgi:predicted nucleic acid-binding protein